jgi:hypothetical protein
MLVKAQRARPQLEAKTKDRAFRFQRLPFEVRRLVYKELLVSNDKLVVTRRGPRYSCNDQKKINIEIMFANKLCVQEGAQVLYGCNAFDIGELRRRPQLAKDFARRIGTQNTSSIKNIVAEYSAVRADPYREGEDGIGLSVSLVRDCLDPFAIKLESLHMFAVKIVPYGSSDKKTTIVQAAQAPDITGSEIDVPKWIERKNNQFKKWVRDKSYHAL